LDEACTIVRRLWTESEPFDFDGLERTLTGAFASPKPVQRPHPPITVAGRTDATLRVVARHADVWNVPGGDLDDCIERSARLDHLCAEIGRDPATITRSVILPVSYDRPQATRHAIRMVLDGGFSRVMLGLAAPYPDGVVRWVADTISVVAR
jgi:alkanesulfonate monooxygenase SsuD/methylene tetrahydromethanopterin reductase-like flavin-dependent oxidoreductase (luciferase family)